MKNIKNGFTLVEIVIVISILSILTAIGFYSFFGHIGKSRDLIRVENLSTINNGIEIQQVSIGKYPTPTYTSAKITSNGAKIFSNYIIDDDFLKSISVTGVKNDTISGEKIVYGISTNKKEYEIASFLENGSTDYSNSVTLLNGNYDGILKYSTGGNIYLVNPPSLLLNNTGSVKLFGTYSLFFLVDNGKNIYHGIKNVDDADTILKDKYGTDATLTGVLVNNVTTNNISDIFTTSNKLLTSFGGSLEVISANILGETVETGHSSCTYNSISFTHGGSKTFYKYEDSTTCETESVIYTCSDGEIYDESDTLIETISEYQYETCTDNSQCNFSGGFLFDGNCHF